MAKIDIQGALRKTKNVVEFLDNILGKDNPEIRAEMENLRKKVSNIYDCFLENQKEISDKIIDKNKVKGFKDKVSNLINKAELKKLMKETEEKIINIYQEIKKNIKYLTKE